ncbi:hypothetical protein BGZ68_001866 [Mortierella alpina]|nr:hypothetical protein BGZ68_001866 [Mortierella alpina]
MHFLTSILILAFAASSRLVAAQDTPPAPPPGQELACGTCILNNIKAVPDCAQVGVNPAMGMDPSKFSDEQKKCFCVLANDLSWANKCSGADVCGAELINYYVNILGPMKAQYCSAGGGGANAKSNANTLTGSISKSAMAALAVGAVLTAF